MELNYLIWSIEHDAWWMPNKSGYTKNISEAGQYEYEETCLIVRQANMYHPNEPYEAMVRVEKYIVDEIKADKERLKDLEESDLETANRA